MQEIVDALIQIGPAGMFVAAFLAGSFFPFSSELVMLGLLEAGADATSLLVWGTIGNTLGGLFNYGVGSMGKEEWVTRRLKISPEKLRRGKVYVRHYGAWAGSSRGFPSSAASSLSPWAMCAPASCPPSSASYSANTCAIKCLSRHGRPPSPNEGNARPSALRARCNMSFPLSPINQRYHYNLFT